MTHRSNKVPAAALLTLLAALAQPRAGVAQDFPRPPGDPAAIARGRQTFSVNCGFCHGSDARGGEGGPNLLRSPIVLNDQHGEAVGAVVLTGRVEKGMPKFNLPENTIADIAAYLHSIHLDAFASAPFDPRKVLVGSAKAGRAFFDGPGRCGTCHSATRDLAGIGAKYDPKSLQDLIFTGGGTGMLGIPSPNAPPRTVTVTWPSGEKFSGRLESVDDFLVVAIGADGARRSIAREGAVPVVTILDPLQAHRDRVREWEDRDLHDVTAYLATLR